MVNSFFRNAPDPREITNDDAANLYGEQGATFVDVREPEEWNEGHVPGSVHIPLGDLQRRAGELPIDGKIVTVCRVGVRSLYAVDALEAAGFTDVKSMAGGVVEWAEKGRPLE